MKSAPLIALLATLGALGTTQSASAAWTRLPQSDMQLINFSIQSDRTSIHSSTGVNQASALLVGDPTQFAKINAGKSEVVIKLDTQQNLDFFVLANNSVNGTLRVSTSTNAKAWIPAGDTTLRSDVAATSVDFAPTQARYVKLEFESATGGNVNGVVLSGNAKAPKVAGSLRTVYIHPTPSNIGTKEFLHNVIEFPASKNKVKTLVFDMSQSRELEELSLSYSKQPTRFEVFVFEKLPESKDWRGKTAISPDFLENQTPVSTAVDSQAKGAIKIKIAGAKTGRYLTLRIEPNFTLANSPVSEFGFDISQFINQGQAFQLTRVDVGSKPNTKSGSSTNENSNEEESEEKKSEEDKTTDSPGADQADQTQPLPGMSIGGAGFDYRSTGGGNNSGTGTGSSPDKKNDKKDQGSGNNNGGTTIIQVPVVPPVS